MVFERWSKTELTALFLGVLAFFFLLSQGTIQSFFAGLQAWLQNNQGVWWIILIGAGIWWWFSRKPLPAKEVMSFDELSKTELAQSKNLTNRVRYSILKFFYEEKAFQSFDLQNERGVSMTVYRKKVANLPWLPVNLLVAFSAFRIGEPLGNKLRFFGELKWLFDVNRVSSLGGLMYVANGFKVGQSALSWISQQVEKGELDVEAGASLAGVGLREASLMGGGK
ncbi:MAG: hypothetical protein ACE5DI_03980 [Candidatus Micrarchaeia archaeon]